jgi:hypothetical protein
MSDLLKMGSGAECQIHARGRRPSGAWKIVWGISVPRVGPSSPPRRGHPWQGEDAYSQKTIGKTETILTVHGKGDHTESPLHPEAQGIPLR